MPANQIRFAMAHSTGIQQRITSGGHFDGTLPTGNTSDAGTADQNGLYKYTAQAAGGLFVWNNYEPILVVQLHVDLGGSGDVTVSVVNQDDAGLAVTDEEIIIYQAQSVRYITLDETHFRVTLLRGQALKLVTTSPGAVIQVAQAVAALERTFVR